MKLPSSPDEYRRILEGLKVKQTTAVKWAPVLYDTIHEDTFSQGVNDFVSFLPEIVYESGYLERLVENLNYTNERISELAQKSPAGSRWRLLLPRSMELAHNPRALANALYSNRYGNGGPETDDGWNMRGRSPIQITFHDNYEWLGDLMGQDLVVNPGLLEMPHYALEACIHYWENRIPDSILGDSLKERKAVNGGKFGLEDVSKLHDELLQIMEA